MKLFDRRSPEERFWAWFEDHRTKLATPPLQTRLMNDLTKRLKAVHEGLVWEAGSLPSGLFEFTVSADGLKAVAPHVRSLVAAAPSIAGWTIQAFRQPSADVAAVQMHGRTLSLNDLAFIPQARRPDGLVDLTILIRDLSGGEQQELIGAAFILLDALLGEETVMFRLGEMDFVPLAEGDGSERPIGELRAFVGVS